jgi:SulP family sulfate permease
VGQVQDVGLIFLSAMATSIAVACQRDGYTPAEALGTSLLTMAASTALVGLVLLAVGARCGGGPGASARQCRAGWT